MKIDDNIKLRLQFLSRVVQRECKHLNKTAERLFVEPFSLERAQQLNFDDDLSERVDAFVSRFSRLQDTLGDKFIPQLLSALGEKQATAMDNFDTAERLGWITSADEWQAIRQLRNQMVHDYIEDLKILISAMQTAQNFVSSLTEVGKRLQAELQQRGWD
jgi:hypothetical protein